MKKLVVLLLLSVMSLVWVNFAISQEEVTLTVVWHAGICAEALLDIAKDYEKVAGVKVVGALVPYGPQWHDKIASEFAAKGSGFDLAAWDSQSVAEFAGGGHCVLLNPYLEKSDKVNFDAFLPAALKRYGEYPDGSGNQYALPVNQDCLGLIYRRDLFEDPKEKEAFKARYGYDLEVPKTYRQLRDIAEFFTRPDQGLYGFAQYGGREYDYCTSMSNTFIWSFGGALWNPKTFEVKGYLNSPASIDGVKFYVDLFKFCPPGSETWGFDEVNVAMQQGRVAMAMQWFYFFGSMLDPSVSKIVDKVGFAILPGEVGRDGKFRRVFSMGGQGLGINKYSKHVEEAWKFLEWYMQKDQQMRYAKFCQTGNKYVLEDPEWLKLNPYNVLFKDAMNYINDYWHLPEYPILLDIMQEEIHNALTGKKTVEQALADCAERHERELRRAGYEIKRTENIPEAPYELAYGEPYSAELEKYYNY
ncbi:MAG: sugar ABC transporter substrate-binding protein [Atribacterota bacterium]